MQDELNGQHWPRKGKYLVKYKQKIITYSDIFKVSTLFPSVCSWLIIREEAEG